MRSRARSFTWAWKERMAAMDDWLSVCMCTEQERGSMASTRAMAWSSAG